MDFSNEDRILTENLYILNVMEQQT